MKNIKESGWEFVCTYIYASKTAGKLISESICRSVKAKVPSSRVLFVPRYHIIDIIKEKL
jgi:hypothetical protein